MDISRIIDFASGLVSGVLIMLIGIGVNHWLGRRRLVFTSKPWVMRTVNGMIEIGMEVYNPGSRSVTVERCCVKVKKKATVRLDNPGEIRPEERIKLRTKIISVDHNQIRRLWIEAPGGIRKYRYKHKWPLRQTDS